MSILKVFLHNHAFYSTYICAMRISSIFILCICLYACGSSKNDNLTEQLTNRQKDLEAGRKTGLEFYTVIINRDSVDMHRFFAGEIRPYIQDLITAIKEREEMWGAIDTIRIERNESRFVPSGKNDTTWYNLTLSTVYQYNQSQDVLLIRKTGKDKPQLIDYSFDRKKVMHCSKEELEYVKPIFEDMVNNLVKRNDSAVKHWFDPDKKFFVSCLDMRDEFLPEKLCKNTHIEYHNGYLRRYCGTQNEANGFITYKVRFDNEREVYITLFITKNADEALYDLYSLYLGETDPYNQNKDKRIAQQLGHEIFRILELNDHKAFYYALHEEAQPDAGVYNEKTAREILENIKSWGDFKAFDQVITYSTQLDIDGKKENEVRYVLIAKLEGEDGDVYAELSFKPDSSGKIKLMAIEYL